MNVQNPRREFTISLSSIDEKIFIHEFLKLCNRHLKQIQSDPASKHYLFSAKCFLRNSPLIVDVRMDKLGTEEFLVSIEIRKKRAQSNYTVQDAYNATRILNKITADFRHCFKEKLSEHVDDQQKENDATTYVIICIVAFLGFISISLVIWYWLIHLI